MSFTFITRDDVIPVSNIKGFNIYETEESVNSYKLLEFKIVVYYINGENISCEHTYDNTFETHRDAREFIREKLGDSMIDDN